MLPLLLLLTAHAGETWDDIREIWSVEVGGSFWVSGDLTGNVRDIPRAYSEAEVAGDVPMGGGLFLRNVVRYPAGKVEPALLLRIAWDRANGKGTFEDYGEYTRAAEQLDLRAGLGLCTQKDRNCIFAAYSYRSLTTTDTNYPITNLPAVLGDPEGVTAEGFTGRYLGELLGDALVDVLVNGIDFESQRVRIDASDVMVMHGAQVATVMGMGERVTLDGALGYYFVNNSHDVTADIQADVNEPDTTEPFSYAYERPMGIVGLDLALSVGVLPDQDDVQLALGLRGSLLTLIDLEPDRSVGGYLQGGVFLSAKW